jgi:O-antigen biosynthesis protein
MVRREVFEKVGGFDVEFAVAYNDVDFCLRVMDAGYRNLYTPYARLIHHESKTRGDDVSPERAKRFDGEKARLLDRWYDLIQSDPYYNPNLTKSREDFSIKRPSEYQ